MMPFFCGDDKKSKSSSQSIAYLLLISLDFYEERGKNTILLQHFAINFYVCGWKIIKYYEA